MSHAAGIVSWGAYVPRARLPVEMLRQAWGSAVGDGERSVAGTDEDSITMAVAAARTALERADGADVDALLFASTTAPFAEHACAAAVAAALDLGPAYTADVTGAVRSATTALRMALALVGAGFAGRVLVVAGDMRQAEPGSAEEGLMGDAGVALVVGIDGVRLSVIDSDGFSEYGPGPWRRAADRFVRTFEPRLDVADAFVNAGSRALRALLDRNGILPADVGRLITGAPSQRALGRLVQEVGLKQTRAGDSLLSRAGSTGAAHPILALVHVLEQAGADVPLNDIVVLGVGDGADAILLRVDGELPVGQDGATVESLLDSGTRLRSYTEYLDARRLLERERPEHWASVTAYWRDRDEEIAMRGGRCRSCGVVQYPPWRGCIECGAVDALEPVSLARAGTVYTFTLDHLAGGRYLETPIIRAVVDLDGGGRAFLEMTDSEPDSVRVGARVDLAFRRVHDGSGLPMYYWKARLPRHAAKRTQQQAALGGSV